MLTLKLDNIFAETIGEQHGITRSLWEQELQKNSHLCLKLKDEQGSMGFTRLPYMQKEARQIARFATQRRGMYRDLVHIGIGGSALGAMAIHESLCPPFYNICPDLRRGYPRIFFLDNIDPAETDALFRVINPRRTLFHIVTKTGETAETLAGFLMVLKALKKIGLKPQRNVVISTGPTGFMRRWGERENVPIFTIPGDVVGRFSALSCVGLLPAAFCGINVVKLLEGAILAESTCFDTTPWKNLAYQFALAAYLLDQRGKRILVIMPYSGQLKRLAEWIRQLWAESLGKKCTLDGRVVFSGQTPTVALGATDQHSQIQLYNEGPNDKIILFLQVQRYSRDPLIPVVFRNEPVVAPFQSRGLAKLLEAEKTGTELALVQNSRPNLTLFIPKLTPQTLGWLLYFFEVATVFAGKLYNVNPFDQPGVDAGKRFTIELMQKGY